MLNSKESQTQQHSTHDRNNQTIHFRLFLPLFHSIFGAPKTFISSWVEIFLATGVQKISNRFSLTNSFIEIMSMKQGRLGSYKLWRALQNANFQHRTKVGLANEPRGLIWTQISLGIIYFSA